MDSNNVLITGLPRSGTTMTCHLLNKLPNSVALHEPMGVRKLASLGSDALVQAIQRFCSGQRASIMREGKARSKASKGQVPTNSRANADASGRRKSIIDGMQIEVRNVTSPDFRLYLKHPAFFTAALPVLAPHFSCFAVIRNPLSVLLSWRVSGMAVANGRMPAAQLFDAALDEELAASSDVLEKQFILLDYCFRQYATFLSGRTLRYEEMITSRGRSLSLVTSAANELDEPLESRNMLGVVTDAAAIDVAKRLLDRPSPCWDFYDRADVEVMLN